MNVMVRRHSADATAQRARTLDWRRVVFVIGAVVLLTGIVVAGSYTIPEHPAARHPGDLLSPRAPA